MSKTTEKGHFYIVLWLKYHYKACGWYSRFMLCFEMISDQSWSDLLGATNRRGTAVIHLHDSKTKRWSILADRFCSS